MVSFTESDAWAAPFFELHVEVGAHPESVPKVLGAIETLWQHPTLDGPYADRFANPSQQAKVREITPELLDTYGVSRLPDGNRVPCGAIAQIPDLALALGLPEELQKRMDYGPNPLSPDPDSFVFYLPTLERLYGVDWWDEALDERIERSIVSWLGELASYVYERVPFEFAVIGAEGTYDEEQIRSGDNPERWGAAVLVPDPEGKRLRRWRGA